VEQRRRSREDHVERPEADPTGPTLDEEGIPDLQGPLPGKAATGDPQEGEPVPSTRPASLDWGVTAHEQRAGEPLSVRIDRERPDFGEPGALDGPARSGFVLTEETGAGLESPDDEKDMIGRAVDPAGSMVGPEESALHVVSDPDEAIADDE
jgi:hypothetical protein